MDVVAWANGDSLLGAPLPLDVVKMLCGDCGLRNVRSSPTTSSSDELLEMQLRVHSLWSQGCALWACSQGRRDACDLATGP